jgi:hypothetical protein
MSNYDVHLESSCFKVKQAKKFQELIYEKIDAEDLEVNLTKHGVKVLATNISDDDFYLEQLIKDNLAEDQTAYLIRVGLNSRGIELAFTASFITDLGYTTKTHEELMIDLSTSVFPRYQTAIDNFYHAEDGLWIEKDKKYLVLEECGDDLIVQHKNGQKLKWRKGDFYGVKRGD